MYKYNILYRRVHLLIHLFMWYIVCVSLCACVTYINIYLYSNIQHVILCIYIYICMHVYIIYLYMYIHIRTYIHRLKFWMQNTLNQQMNLGTRNFIQPFHPSAAHLGPRHAGWCWHHFDLDSFKTVFLIFQKCDPWPTLINLNPTEEQTVSLTHGYRHVPCRRRRKLDWIRCGYGSNTWYKYEYLLNSIKIVCKWCSFIPRICH